MHLNTRRGERFDPGTIRLPLIALIDVVLFLLFYFVISYSVSAEESELSTGFATTGVSDAMTEPLVVQVAQTDAGAEFRVGVRTFNSRDALTDLLRVLPKEQGVVVRADPGVPVSATVAAVQAGKDAGFTSVRFAIGP